MSRIILRVILANALIVFGAWVSYLLIINAGLDDVANWIPKAIFYYMFPAGLIVQLIMRFHDLAKSPSLLSKELDAILPAVKKRTSVLWSFVILILITSALAVSAGLVSGFSVTVQFGWLYLACIGFFLATLLFVYTVLLFVELRDFEWQVSERAKQQAERDDYVGRMRADSLRGFESDDAIDGSKRKVIGEN